jgi:hypothetical protein
MSWDEVNQIICEMSELVQIAERLISSGVVIFRKGIPQYHSGIPEGNTSTYTGVMETMLYCWVET